MSSTIVLVIISVLYVLGCGVLIGIILMQKKRTAGIGNTITGMGGYWEQNKGRSVEGQLEKYTKIGAFIFIVATICTWFLK